MRVIKDICYCQVEDDSRKLDLYLTEAEEFSVFIYFHGGGLGDGDKIDGEQFASYLTDRNIAVITANYRMYPVAVYPQFIQDAADVVAWAYRRMCDYGICQKFFVGGSSAGAYLSMMLCFDETYLLHAGIKPGDIDGYIHDAGQPTCHFNVLHERGMDLKRVVVDDAAPLYHIGTQSAFPPMLFLVSDNDIECRYEQTMLIVATMKYFGYKNYTVKVMHGTHCQYVFEKDEKGESIFGQLICGFLEQIK